MTDREKSVSSANKPEPNRGVDWADPTVPVGNAPPLPRWPLAAFALAWLGWVAFLAVMAVARHQSGV